MRPGGSATASTSVHPVRWSSVHRRALSSKPLKRPVPGGLRSRAERPVTSSQQTRPSRQRGRWVKLRGPEGAAERRQRSTGPPSGRPRVGTRVLAARLSPRRGWSAGRCAAESWDQRADLSRRSPLLAPRRVAYRRSRAWEEPRWHRGRSVKRPVHLWWTRSRPSGVLGGSPRPRGGGGPARRRRVTRVGRDREHTVHPPAGGSGRPPAFRRRYAMNSVEIDEAPPWRWAFFSTAGAPLMWLVAPVAGSALAERRPGQGRRPGLDGDRGGAPGHRRQRDHERQAGGGSPGRLRLVRRGRRRCRHDRSGRRSSTMKKDRPVPGGKR